MRIARTRRKGLGVLAGMLVLAACPAWAVDVDRIEIRSGLGEPLLAEIPVTGATPQELAQLTAQLASSTTFARSGLPRPQGVVADLRFEVVRGPRPVIRVTSQMPVQDGFLTFLVQVDSAQDRIVREYSISLGAAPSMPATVSPQIQAPVLAPGSEIVRPEPQLPVVDPANVSPAPPPVVAAPIASTTAAPLPIPEAPPMVPPPADPIPLSRDTRPPRNRPATRPVPLATPQPQATAARQVPRAIPPAPARQPAPRAAAATPAATPQRAPGPNDYRVQPGDNLSRVVDRMGFDGSTEAQAMAALLRTNPAAFSKGNINQLQRGAILLRPSRAELTRLSPAQAEALVRLQIEQWRSGNIPDPPVAAAAPPAAPAALTAAPLSDGGNQAVAPARLEIAPASSGQAQSPGSAGGASGASSAQQRQVEAANRTVTRYTEFQEMQARIADLEAVQREQQRLLELKDRQLAAQPRQAWGWAPWLIAGLALVVSAIALLRGRRPERPGKVASTLSANVSRGEREEAAGTGA